jgi:hypothetical protein
MAPFWSAKKRVPKHPNGVTEGWALYEGVHEGRAMHVRFDGALGAAAGHPDFPIQIGIAIPFNEPDDKGMPGLEEAPVLWEIEDRIVGMTKAQAVLACVITTNGMREFVLYTGSGEWIEPFHVALQDATPTHDVQAFAQTDPEWTVYRRLAR